MSTSAHEKSYFLSFYRLFLGVAFVGLSTALFLHEYCLFPWWSLPLWVSVSLCLFGVRGLVREVRLRRRWYTASLLESFLFVFWIAVGVWVFSISRDDAAKSQFNVELAGFQRGTTKDLVYEGYLLAAQLVIPDMAHAGKGNLGTQQLLFREMYNAVKERKTISDMAIARVSDTSLRTDAAKQLLQNSTIRRDYLQQLTRDMRPIVELSEVPDSASVETWNDRRLRLMNAHRDLAYTVGLIAASRLVLSQRRGGLYPPEALRSALVEVKRWPGLCDEQFNAVAHTLDEQPLTAQLLLVEYAVLNAQRVLADCGEVNSEPAVIARLRKNYYINLLLP